MAERITEGIVNHVSALAKLKLTKEERNEAGQDMQRMLDYIDCLNELDTEKVEPLSHIFSINNVFRKDVVTNGNQRSAMLANAPGKKDGRYQVPRTVE